MKILNDEKHIETILLRFKELITERISPEELSETLDEVIFKYAMYILEDTSAVGNLQQERDELYWLKMLRDLFITKKIQS